MQIFRKIIKYVKIQYRLLVYLNYLSYCLFCLLLFELLVQSTGHFQSFFSSPDPKSEKKSVNQIIKKFWPNIVHFLIKMYSLPSTRKTVAVIYRWKYMYIQLHWKDISTFETCKYDALDNDAYQHFRMLDEFENFVYFSNIRLRKVVNMGTHWCDYILTKLYDIGDCYMTGENPVSWLAQFVFINLYVYLETGLNQSTS